jgi:hypothetical protein
MLHIYISDEDGFLKRNHQSNPDTKREHCTKVFFKTTLGESTKEPLINFCSAFDIGFKKIFGHVFIDSGVIRPYKERKKNLKPIKPRKLPDLEPIIVDTYQQAKKLTKELKELGVSRKIGVRSNHNTMRYSRVIS